VGADLVSGRRDPAHQLGLPLGQPSEHEERRPGITLGEQVKQALQAPINSALVPVPLFRLNLDTLVPVLESQSAR